MPTPPLSDEVLQEAVDAYRYHGHQKGPASRALGMPKNTFAHRLKLAAERGLIGPEETLPGFVYTSVSTRMDGDGAVKTFALAFPDKHINAVAIEGNS